MASEVISNSAFKKCCNLGESSGCIISFIFFFGIPAYGLLPIVVIGADVWSAFRKRKHWIPADSLVLGALALQFVALLQISFSFSSSYVLVNRSEEMCDLLDTFAYDEIHVLSGRVSICVLMGCLLPGVSRPLSASLWSDMAALIISSSIFLFQVSYEAQMLHSAFHYVHHCGRGMTEFYSMQLANAMIIVSIIFLVLILGSAALASVTIPQNISPKIPTIFPPPDFHKKFQWEKVEEQVTKSWIVVRTSDPQYIITRSCLSSFVALIISACNGVLVCQLLVFGNPFDWELGYTLTSSIESLLRFVVIVMGSLVIYWRCVTQVVYYPKGLGWRFSSFSQYFQIEDMWKAHLLKLMRSSRGNRRLGRSCLVKIIFKLCRVMRLHRLLHVVYWLQMFSVLFGKFCCLLSQLLFSNKCFGKLLMGSGYQEFSDLYRSEIRLGEYSDYSRYFKALINMQGENSAGLWVANKNSTRQVKKQMDKGEDEGKKCDELISLLKGKSALDFCGEKCVKPQNDLLNRLQVERELDVRKCSWKMTAISIIAVLIELSAFVHDEAEAEISVKRAIEACSQAWNIMEVVENNATETVEVSVVADEIFWNLEKRHKWLEYSLPLIRPVDRSPAAAKTAIQNLVEKGKEIANQNCSRKPSEAIAGYSLYRIGRLSMDREHQFDSVGEIRDRMCRMLADVMGSCCVKAAGVIMEDCKKLATKSDEERILKIAGVAGKVKGVTESVGWTLKWSSEAESPSINSSLAINTSLATEEAPKVRRYHTFQIR